MIFRGNSIRGGGGRARRGNSIWAGGNLKMIFLILLKFFFALTYHFHFGDFPMNFDFGRFPVDLVIVEAGDADPVL